MTKMTEEDGSETHLTIAKGLKTKGDKARAAAQIGQFAKTHGVPHEEAARGAAHELKHALADPEEGEMGAVMKKRHIVAGAFYEPKGERSHKQLLKIELAPGRDMSGSDVKHAARNILDIIAGWFTRK